MSGFLTIHIGDWVEHLKAMPANSVHCCVTSPPYWGLRDYGVPGQLGLEKTLKEYIAKMVDGFREVRRVLREDGTLWLNLGDSYATNGGHTDTACNDRRGAYNLGNRPEHAQRDFRCRPDSTLKPKDLCGIPWRVALALQADGWFLRSDIIWAKPNPMPESVTDRPTKSHEYLFLLTKSPRYFYDAEAVKEPVTGGAHPRANGKHRRMVQERTPDGLTNKPNPSRSHVPGNVNPPKGQLAYEAGDFRQRTKAGLLAYAQRVRAAGVCPKSAEPGTGIKANASFSATVVNLVARRNKRSVWTIATAPFKGAHFATFPPKLVEPCILAGTSTKGCCSQCGAPWRRIVERPAVPKADYTGKFSDQDNRAKNLKKGLIACRANGGDHDNPFPASQTVGWEPTCKCDCPEVTPCTVLDPFGGSGTTGMVSLELGRRAVLIELNLEYVEMGKVRTDVTPGLPLA